MASPLFDLVLLGYRNELACERVLAYLRSLPDAQGGPVVVARDTLLPAVVRRGIDHETGLRLLGELRDRGGHARLVAEEATAAPPSPPAPPVKAPPEDGPARAARGGSWAPLALIGIALAAVVYRETRPLPPPLPPSVAELQGTADSPFALQLDAVPRELNDEAVSLNATGHYADAADKLRTALTQAPEQPALQRNLKTVLHNWAVAELNADRVDNAVALLEEGLALEEDPVLLSVLGIAQVRRDEWGAARTTLERAVELGAADPHTLVMLGKVYRQQGQREAAVEMLHRARDAGAHGPDFESTLSRLERELDAEWDFTEMRSPHFDIAFAGGERESTAAAEAVARGLENAYFHAGAKLERYPTERIPVVLYASEAFHDITQTPSWTGGVYDGRIKLPSGGVESQHPAVLERTLRHEYGHVLVTQLSRGRAPVWLNEGVAIWCEEDRDGDREDWAYETLSGQVLFPLAQLAGSFTSLPPDRVHAAYAQSYLVVRELVVRAGPRSVRTLLTALGEGQSLERAFHTAAGQTLASFERQLIRELTTG